LMPIGALATTLVVGYVIDFKALKEGFGPDRFKFIYPWYFLVKYILPFVILAVFIMQLL
ncbi:TPA: sodium-dependent transporter, partial [Staphylococcus aureus]|nr:sodium-dependent transporter [Staphylococcus aureus]